MITSTNAVSDLRITEGFIAEAKSEIAELESRLSTAQTVHNLDDAKFRLSQHKAAERNLKAYLGVDNA